MGHVLFVVMNRGDSHVSCYMIAGFLVCALGF